MASILELLDARGLAVEEVGSNEYAIVCPNATAHQGGVDSKPSFSINIEKQVGNCLACGFAMKSTRLLEWLYGGSLDEDQLAALVLRAKLKGISDGSTDSLYEEERVVFMPPGTPWAEDGYRGISLQTYEKLGAIKVSRGRYENRIAFPVTVEGKLIGIDARALLPDMQPKYLRNYGSTCNKNWLYPYDLVKTSKPELVTLGEGIFHAINALDKGYAGLCFFGCNNWSMTKLRMILATGAKEVCFVRDNDAAGIKAEQIICAALDEYIEVKTADVADLPAGVDQGDMSQEQMDQAVAGRVKPLLPVCLTQNAVDKSMSEPGFGIQCRNRRCPYYKNNQCNNLFWLPKKNSLDT